MSEAKQIIIVRNDLRSKLRHGKLAAQVAHASVAAFLSGRYVGLNDHADGMELRQDLDNSMYDWISGAFAKVVLKCDDEAHILQLRDLCLESNIRHYLIRDAGRTVFRESTYTCLGVGPEYSDTLDTMFGHLKLY